jgi:hypothetical protein
MATQAELIQTALNEIRQANVSVDEWCMRVSKGGYRYMGTHVYKALKALEASAKIAPPRPKPPQPIPTDLGDVQRCLFLTNDISRAMETTNRLLIATADMTYRNYYTNNFIAAAINQNRFRVWCDCHTTMPEMAYAWLDQLGLPHDHFYGECESAPAFDVAYRAGSRKMVGNLSSLTDGQITVIRGGIVHVTNETYFNVNPNYPVDWRNANAGVGSNCMAVYESSTEHANYYSLAQQHSDGKYNPANDCVYVAGFQTQDWAYLIAH